MVVVNGGREFCAEADQVRGGELAFEDGVLEVIAVASHDFEHLAEAFVVGDVVADEVGFAHWLIIDSCEFTAFPRSRPIRLLSFACIPRFKRV